MGKSLNPLNIADSQHSPFTEQRKNYYSVKTPGTRWGSGLKHDFLPYPAIPSSLTMHTHTLLIKHCGMSLTEYNCKLSNLPASCNQRSVQMFLPKILLSKCYMIRGWRKNKDLLIFIIIISGCSDPGAGSGASGGSACVRQDQLLFLKYMSVPVPVHPFRHSWAKRTGFFAYF